MTKKCRDTFFSHRSFVQLRHSLQSLGNSQGSIIAGNTGQQGLTLFLDYLEHVSRIVDERSQDFDLSKNSLMASLVWHKKIPLLKKIA